MGAVDHVVQKIEIPIVAANGQGTIGMFGPGGRIGALVLPRSGVSANDTLKTAETYYELPLGRPPNDTHAISIAGDSAIACADVFLSTGAGSQQRHRIAPGRPLVMDLRQYERALISPAVIMPSVGNTVVPTKGTLNDWRRQYQVWDSAEVMIAPEGALTVPTSVPLKVELHRGGVGIVDRKRPVYRAALRFDTTTANGVSQANDDAGIYVCVDGRVRVDVHLWLDSIASGTPTYQIDAIEGVIGSAGTNGAGAATYNLVPATAIGAQIMITKSFIGNPMQMIRAFIAGTATGFTGTIRVDAWDE